MTDSLKLILEEEQNAHAELGKHNNGGGYHQPYMVYEGLFNDAPIGVSIDDKSCGEFGDRYDVYVDCDGIEYWYQFDGVGQVDDIEYGNIPKDIAEFIEIETGYYCLFRR